MKRVLLFLTMLLVAVNLFAQGRKNQNKKNADNQEENAQEKNDPNTMKITGYADTQIAPDYVEVYMNKEITGKDIDDNTDANIEAEIKECVKAAGIDADKVMVTSTINAYEKVHNNTPVRMFFTLKIREMSRLDDAKNKLDNANVSLSNHGYGVMYTIYGIDDGTIDIATLDKILLARAIKDGKQKAAETADELGIKNYRLLSFNENNNDKQQRRVKVMGTAIEGLRFNKRVTMNYTLQ